MKTFTRALRAFFVAILAFGAVTSTRAQFGPADKLTVWVYRTAGTDQIEVTLGTLFADGRLIFDQVFVPVPTAPGFPAAQVLGLSAAQVAAINGKPLYSALDWSDTGDTFSRFRRSSERYIILDLPYYIVSAAPSSGTAISPATRSIVAGGATAQTIAVTSSTSWTATAGVSWLTITGGASGSGNGTVTYNVDANTAAQQRVGVITVAGQAHTVTQAAATTPVSGPVITAQPGNLVASVGGSVTFNVAATGTAPLNYQWRKDGVNITGATSASLTLSNVHPAQAGSYAVIITNANGSVTSTVAVLTMNAPSPGTVVAWGYRFEGQTTVPVGLNGVTAIAAGGYHTVALKSDGTVVAWGATDQRDNFGQTTVPAGLSGVTTIAAGFYHTVALKSDGTVVAWGDNRFGQTTVPAGLNGVTAIAAGGYHTVALKSDGAVVAWGAGKTNTDSHPEYGQSIVPAGLSGVTAIAAGDVHTLVLKRDGTVVAWGDNRSGQTTVPAGLSGVTAMAAGNNYTVALKSNGTVVAWGITFSGETNVPANLSGVTAIAASAFHTVALKSDGTVVAWGGNSYGETTVPAGLSGVLAIAAGTFHTVALVASASQAGRLINLSVLAPLTAAGDSFSLGYVVSGATATNTKPLVIRAGGPSLGALGVPGTLADPKLELFAGSTKTGENDDWGGSAATNTAMAAVGGFAYTGPTSRDAALATNITSRDNSVKISAGASAPNGTGTVIAEVYDATPTASFTTATPRLINFSVIKNVGTSVTLGFVIGGATNETVLVRAVGPSLGIAPFNLGGVMADPKVELFNAAGTSLATNDNWSGTAALTAAFSQTGAFALSSTSKDAALVATLAPGNYSVVVTPVSNTVSGTALLEVYEVP